MRALVYDSEAGYFEFINGVIAENLKNIEVIRFDHANKGEFDILVFFLHSELELLDFFKLYSQGIPVVFASSVPQLGQQLKYNIDGENMYYLNLNHHREHLASDVMTIFKNIQA